jgi:hypothetical protein
MADPEVVERLDLMIAILQLAHHDAIEQARKELRADPLTTAVLEACSEDWVRSGDLQKSVAAASGVGERTIRVRLAELVTRRAIARRGAGRNTEYRSMGLV